MNYNPPRKCGAESMLLGSAIGSNLFSFAGSLAANETNRSVSGDQIRLQQEENEKNRVFNADQAALARDFTTTERLASQEYQTSEWNRQQAYLSPKAQSQRLLQAGINPAVYFSGSQVAQGQSVSAPSGESGMPASFNGGLSPVAFPSQIPQMMSSAASVLSSLGSFVKNTEEAKQVAPQASAAIQQALSSVGLNEASAAALKVEKSLKEAKLPYAAQQAFVEYIGLELQNVLAIKQGEVFESEKRLNECKSLVEEALEKVHGETAIKLRTEWSQMQLIFDSTKKNLDADTAFKYSSAANQKSEAHARNKLLYLQEQGLKLDNAVKQRDVQVLRSTWKEYRDAVRSQLESDKTISDQKKAESLRRLNMVDKWYNTNNTNMLFRVVDDAISYIADNIGISMSGSFK